MEQQQHAALTDQLVEQKRRRYQAMLTSGSRRRPITCSTSGATQPRAQRERKLYLLTKSLDHLANLKLFQAWRSWTLFVERARIAGIQGQLQGGLNKLKTKQIQALLQRSFHALPCVGPDTPLLLAAGGSIRRLGSHCSEWVAAGRSSLSQICRITPVSILSATATDSTTRRDAP